MHEKFVLVRDDGDSEFYVRQSTHADVLAWSQDWEGNGMNEFRSYHEVLSGTPETALAHAIVGGDALATAGFESYKEKLYLF